MMKIDVGIRDKRRNKREEIKAQLEGNPKKELAEGHGLRGVMASLPPSFCFTIV